MLCQIVVCEVEGLEPQGKYLLARLGQCLGRTGSITPSVRDLAKRFDLPVSHASSALAALVANGVLACETVPCGKGRPRKRYSLDSGFLTRLKSVALHTPGPHQLVIARVLEHEKRARVGRVRERADARQEMAGVRSRRSCGGLTVVNRLLLAVLLVHADRFGVVRDLGSAALCRATGLSRKQLVHRLRRLVDQGLIRTFVAGATNSLFARKETSTYFMNLGHPELMDSGSQVLTLACIPNALTEDNEFQHGERLFIDASRRRQGAPDLRVEFGSSYVKLLHFIGCQPRHIFELIQLKIEAYASQLLSTRWTKLTDRFRLDEAGLCERIQNDFNFENSVSSATAASTAQERAQQSMTPTDQLYRMALDLALDIKRWLSAVLSGDFPLADMDYVIVPQTWAVGYTQFVLVARPRNTFPLRGCVIVESGLYRLAKEPEMPLPDQYRYGMRRQPRGVIAAQV